jgi:3-hydroxybutyryl-CoA dehydrogenase
MGIGISLVAAQTAQVPVLLLDSNENQLEKQMKFLGTSLSVYIIPYINHIAVDLLLQKDVKKGKISEDERKQTKSRIQTTGDIKQFRDCDFIIEAVAENPALKRELFASLAQITRPETILATNTSSISITKIASSTLVNDQSRDRPNRVIGMHFMNPVPVMKLVEIIPGLATDRETVLTTRRLANAMGKVTTLSEDMPGFIANRLLMPYINEAVLALQEVDANYII